MKTYTHFVVTSDLQNVLVACEQSTTLSAFDTAYVSAQYPIFNGTIVAVAGYSSEEDAVEDNNAITDRASV